MRRRLIPAALSIAALSAVALTAPSVYAAPAAHGHAAKAGGVKVSDPRGDVVVKSGTLSDINPDASGVDPFRPGKGTAVPATAADQAMDLTKVTYRVRRTGAHPTLTVRYVVAGPFTYSNKASQTGTTYTDTQSVDGVEVILSKGYTLEATDDGIGGDNGLMNRRGKKVRCTGLRTTMKRGARVATQTVPLSCLAGVGVRSSKLRAVTMHGTFTASAVISDPSTTSSVHPTTVLTIATDNAKPTRRLQLTPLAK